MGIFGFETAFINAVNEVEAKGFRKHYADRYTENVECIIDERDVVYDTNDNIMEDQNRYLYMVSTGALIEVESKVVNEGVKLTDFQRGSYLHEAKASYMISIANPLGWENVYVTKLGEFLYANPADNPKMSLTTKQMKNRYGKNISNFSEVKNFNGSNQDEIINDLEKKVGLEWTIRKITKL